MELSFEQAMARLDELTSQMEKPDITLDDSMNCYKEAVELVNFCKKYLEDAKLSVEKLEKQNEN
ncbi:MAG: exodeoxyribonuclease VII small subunit [Eubacterium sp.]|nr:exodeoxyribonuclease VII small subunit [Eubacterium sp.]